MADSKLKFSATVALARELTDRLYGTFARKVRESVSNAVDAGATDVWLSFQKGPKGWAVTLTDNGAGMNETILRQQFLQLGASEKRFDRSKIGRIGIGVLALTLGTEVILSSRRKNGAELEVSLNLTGLFDPANANKPLDSLDLGIPITRVSSPPPGLETFTRLHIPLLRPELADELEDQGLEELRTELERVLPLRPDPNSPLLTWLRGAGEPSLAGLADDLQDVKPAVRVWFNKDQLFRRLYDPKGAPPQQVKPISFEVPGVKESDPPARVWGFILDAGHAVRHPGIEIRLKNMFLERDWFGVTGGNPIARTWTVGEIFLDHRFDDDLGLNLDRTGLLPRHPQVRHISREMNSLITEFIKGIAARRQSRPRKGLIASASSNVAAIAEAVRKQATVITGLRQTAGDDRDLIARSVLESIGYDPSKDVVAGAEAVTPTDADFVILGMGYQPAFPIIMDRHPNALFTSMDELGVSIGVRTEGPRWEVWQGRGPRKRLVSTINVDQPSIPDAAALVYLSKKQRWGEEVVTSRRDDLVESPVRPVSGVLLKAPKSKKHMLGLLTDSGATILSAEGKSIDYVLEVSSAQLSPWISTESHVSLVRGRAELLTEVPEPIWLLVLPDRSLAQVLVRELLSHPSSKLGLYPLKTQTERLMTSSEKALELLAVTVDRGDGRVDSISFRSPVSLRDVLLGDALEGKVMAWRLVVGSSFLTVFANHFISLPALEPENLEPWKSTLARWVGV